MGLVAILGFHCSSAKGEIRPLGTACENSFECLALPILERIEIRKRSLNVEVQAPILKLLVLPNIREPEMESRNQWVLGRQIIVPHYPSAHAQPMRATFHPDFYVSNHQRERGRIDYFRRNLNTFPLGRILALGLPVDDFYPLLHPGFLQTDTVSHRSSSLGALFYLHPYGKERQESYSYERPIGPFNPCMGFWRFLCGVICLCSGCVIARYRDGRNWILLSLLFLLGAGFVWTYGKEKCDCERAVPQSFQHNTAIVPQKYLDSI